MANTKLVIKVHLAPEVSWERADRLAQQILKSTSGLRVTSTETCEYMYGGVVDSHVFKRKS